MTQGLTLEGEYLGIEGRRGYTAKDGSQREPVVVKVLVGNAAFSVEYQDRISAEDAVGRPEPKRGDAIALDVFVSGAWDPERQRRGPVYFQGKRVAS
jgi:hypothetical protein